MTRQRKPSSATLKIMKRLNHSPCGAHGYALMKETGLASGTLYPILARLVDRGWLDKDWEMSEEMSKPPRRIYKLTSLGRAQFEHVADTTDLQPQIDKIKAVK